MIDTHCHVHDKAFDEDRDATIERARVAGVETMVTIGEDLADSRRAIAAAHRYDLRVAVGIHPHEAVNAPADLEGELTAMLDDPRVVAVGEIGLDYYYDRSPRDVQVEVMRRQLRVARELERPVVFHQRDAFDDFVAVLRELWSPQMRGVVHCFTGTTEQARTYADEFGLLLGIGGVMTFPKAQELRDAVIATGLPSIVLETDAPFLAPVPERGKRNEPAFVAHTARRLSELLGRSLEDVAAQTSSNARRLFAIG